VGQAFVRLVTKCVTCLRNSFSTFISRWTTSFWCAIRTCCWEKPLPWWCWYSCYCAWLHRLCSRTWYVKCYKFVCMLFFKLLHMYIHLLFHVLLFHRLVHGRYIQSIRNQAQGSAFEVTEQHLWSCSTVRLWITSHNKSS